MERVNSKKLKETSGYSIPSELLENEILTRLPIKSLCRFKCISKSWRSLFEDPVFFEKVRPKAPIEWQIEDQKLVFVYSIDVDDGFATLVDKYELDGLIWSSRYCNGLICFSDWMAKSLSVFNPTTGELIELPLKSRNFEFGFDPSSRKYKILDWSHKDPSDIRILTLENHSTWRVVRHATNITSLGSSSVFASGRFFWRIDEPAHIISFNLANEEFDRIEYPIVINKEDFTYTLFEFEGSLCLAEQPGYYDKEEGCHLEFVNLWMLKDIGNSFWISLIKNIPLPLQGTDMDDYNLQEHREAEIFSQRGEIVVAAADGKAKEHLFLYNFLNKQFRRIKIRGLPPSDMAVKNHVDNDVSFEDIEWINAGRTFLNEF